MNNNKEIKLTAEQSQMVADNEKLIYGYAKLHNIDLNEYYGLLAIELCVAVATWNPEKSKLGTYYYNLAYNRMWKEYRARSKRGDLKFCSFDEYDWSIDDSYEYELPEDYGLPEGVMRDVVDMRVKGYTFDDISDELNISKSKAKSLVATFKKGYIDDRQETC